MLQGPAHTRKGQNRRRHRAVHQQGGRGGWVGWVRQLVALDVSRSASRDGQLSEEWGDDPSDGVSEGGGNLLYVEGSGSLAALASRGRMKRRESSQLLLFLRENMGHVGFLRRHWTKNFLTRRNLVYPGYGGKNL